MIFVVIGYIIGLGIVDPVYSDAYGKGLARVAYKDILWNNFYAVVVCLLLFIISFLLQIIAITMKDALSHSLRQSIAILSQCIFCVSLWIFADSKLLTIWINYDDIKHLLTYLAFTSMFAFLFEFIVSLYPDLKKVVIGIYTLYALELFLIIKYFIHFQDKRAYIVLIQCIVILVSIPIFKKILQSLKKDSTSFSKYLLFGYIILMIAGICSMFFYYHNQTKIEYSLIFTSGVTVFCLFLTITSLHRVGESIMKEAKEDAYKRLAYTDEMTNIHNKTAYVEFERGEIAEDLILVVCDLNHLKRINDYQGHRAGDEAIIQATNYLVKYFSREDCYRFGGDEFVVTLTGYTKQQVSSIIDDMKATMEQDNKDREVKVKFAFGFAQRENNESVRSLFLRADQLMYEDKMKSGSGR